ncbi:MAG: TrkH family potassium uptake protein [Anaerolineales bacterium]|jgi:trk system potassium uptake protein TrkH
MGNKIPIAGRLVLGLLALIAVGTLLFMLPGVGRYGTLTFKQALFTAVSAFSVTGLSIITPANDLSLLGQVFLLIMIQLGGVGFMVLVVITLRAIGRKVTLVDRLALTNQLGLVTPGAVLSLTWRLLLITIMFELVGAVLLGLHWRALLGPGRAAFYGLFHAVSAFCNAGFDLFSGLPQFPEGIPNDNVTLLILGSLIFLGGLGIPVLFELLNWAPRQRLTLHTRVTLTIVLMLVVLGGVSLFVSEWFREGLLVGTPLVDAVIQAFFQSISARTAGFPGLTQFEQLAPPSQLIMIVLMFIGSAPASMGGGITTGTLAVLLLSLWSYIRGYTSTRFSGRSISPDALQRAAAVFILSLLVVLLATWVILITNTYTLDGVLFEVISAFATCGLSLAMTAKLNNIGLAVIMLMMIWGRLGALTVVIAMLQRRQPEHVFLPTEQLLIG